MSPARRASARLAAVALLVLAAAGPAQADELVADLSDHLIAVTTGFTGANVLLFGAVAESPAEADAEAGVTGEPGRADIAIVVRGPEERRVVRRKSRIAGIWVNDRYVVFPRAPSFYALAASGPLWEIANRAERDRHQIGIDSLLLEADDVERDSVAYNLFRQALVRQMQIEGLYPPEIKPVTFLGNQLFRVRIEFPANVPTGTYLVEVFLLRGGKVVNAQTTPLVVSKAGFSADVFQFANDRGGVYGIVAIVAALLAGLFAAAVFRRV